MSTCEKDYSAVMFKVDQIGEFQSVGQGVKA